MKIKFLRPNGPGPFARFTAITLGLAALLLTSHNAHAAFGVTSSGGYYTVNNGANLVFMIKQSGGDMTSCKYKGVEYQDQTKPSHVESGLGSGASISATTSGNNIIITEHSSTWYGSGNIYHYLVVQNGVDNIYMATYVDSNGGGELRWLAYMDYTVSSMPPGMAERDQTGGSLIEAGDTFVLTNGPDAGQTRSKYMGSQMAKDLAVLGAPGSGIGVYIAFGNRESSSGAPFFRDIQECSESTTLGGPGYQNVIYNYLYSGHEQTESQRLNVLYGPYAMMFTSGTTPSVPDMSFMYGLGLEGAVAASGRGKVVLNGINGMNSAYTYAVGFANTTAQYWVSGVAGSGSGGCECTGIKPGTYTMTIYKGQLAVYTGSVTVTAGGVVTLHPAITGDPSTVATIWRIGDWDGTPLEYEYGAQQTDGFPDINVMHPSDIRMSWKPVTFTVGSSASSFPAYQWRDENNPITVKFNLTSAQVAAHNVTIGLTAAYSSGRPQITVNSWTSPAPSSSSQPASRCLTIGTYRGNNTTYTYAVPASAFVSGANTMTISCISGASESGWVGPSYSFDCIELDN
jgi:rhamnogalacturonan endolyase